MTFYRYAKIDEYPDDTLNVSDYISRISSQTVSNSRVIYDR